MLTWSPAGISPIEEQLQSVMDLISNLAFQRHLGAERPPRDDGSELRERKETDDGRELRESSIRSSLLHATESTFDIEMAAMIALQYPTHGSTRLSYLLLSRPSKC